MSPEILIAFIAACILLALTPGPNMSLILANTLAAGLRAGLVTLAGTTTGLALLVAAAAVGMTSVMVFMSEWFDVIRWIGALYLVYLGARQLWLLRRRATGAAPPSRRAGSPRRDRADLRPRLPVEQPFHVLISCEVHKRSGEAVYGGSAPVFALFAGCKPQGNFYLVAAPSTSEETDDPSHKHGESPSPRYHPGQLRPSDKGVFLLRETLQLQRCHR
jgi:hypothetical protein